MADEAFAKLMTDNTVYTFNLDAHEMVKQWVAEAEAGKSASKPS